MQKVINNSFVLSVLYLCILCSAGSCAGNKKMSYQQAKELAKQETQEVKAPVEVKTQADSVNTQVHPDQLEPGKPMEKSSDEGLQLIITKLVNGMLDIKALQAPRTIRDTIKVPVPVNVFNECEIDEHLTPEQVEQKIKEEVDRHLLRERENDGLGKRLSDVLMFIAWSLAGLLFLFFIIVAYRIYKIFFKDE